MCDYSRKPVKWQVGNFSYIYWLSTASLRDLFAVGTYLGLLLSYIYAITCSYIVMSNVDCLFLNPILVDSVYIS